MSLEQVLKYIPDKISSIILENIKTIQKDTIEEIRFRVNKPLVCHFYSENFKDLLKNSIKIPYVTNKNDIEDIFRMICENSVYRHTKEVCEGFITIKGGNRVGVVGTAIIGDGKIQNVVDINAINFRISNQILGAADRAIDHIVENGFIKSTLLISKPKQGKTTLLRDITRQISNMGFKVALIDERGEIAAVKNGIPTHDIGLNTDVLDRFPKYEAMIMSIRSMSPDVIVTDEISTKDDVVAIKIAESSGVSIISSCHAGNILDLKKREIYELLKFKIFKLAFILDKNKIFSVENL